MAKIKVTSKCAVYDGMSITFKAPCNYTQVDGLKIGTQSFVFKNALGTTLTSNKGNLFSTGSYVTAVLDTGKGYAYLQNNVQTSSLVNVTTEVANALGLSSSATVSDALTLLNGRAKIEVGSYKGTGDYYTDGMTSYKNSITFSFVPKIVIITSTSYNVNNGLYPSNGLWAVGGFIWTHGQTNIMHGNGTDNLVVSLSGTTLTWYTKSASMGPSYQLNNSSCTYNYIAIG